MGIEKSKGRILVCTQIDDMIEDEKKGIEEYTKLTGNMDAIGAFSSHLGQIIDDERSHLASLG